MGFRAIPPPPPPASNVLPALGFGISRGIQFLRIHRILVLKVQQGKNEPMQTIGSAWWLVMVLNGCEATVSFHAFSLFMQVFVPAGTPEECAERVEADWEFDSKGKDYMDFEMFREAIFQVWLCCDTSIRLLACCAPIAKEIICLTVFFECCSVAEKAPGCLGS